MSQYQDSLKQHAIVFSAPQDIADILRGTKESDIDMWMPPAQARAVLHSGYQQGARIEIKRHIPYKALLYYYRSELDHLLMLDLHWHVSYWLHGTSYQLNPALEEAAMRSAQRDSASGWLVVSPLWRQFFILCSLCFKHKSGTHYAKEYAHYSTQDHQEFYTLLTETIGFSKAECDTIIGCFSVDQPLPAALQSVLIERAFAPAKRLQWYPFSFWFSLRFSTWKAPLVAVIGLDGTGKSTLVDTITKRIPLKLRLSYWGSRGMVLPTTKWHYRLEKRFLHTDRMRTDNPEYKPLPEQVAQNKRRRAWWKWPLLAMIWCNNYLEYWAKYLIARIHRLCGCAMICDRYVYDEWAEIGGPFYTPNRWLYKWFFPKPSLLVITTAQADTVHQRRPTISCEQAAHHLALYDSIAQQCQALGVEVMILSSENPLEQNVKQLLSALFSPTNTLNNG